MKKIILISIISMLALSGCMRQSRFYFEGRKVTIVTSPPGAQVYQVNSAYGNDTFLGTTPIMNQPVSVLSDVQGRVTPTLMDWYSTQMYMLQVRIEKEGYETYKGNLATDPVETLKHTIPLQKKPGTQRR